MGSPAATQVTVLLPSTLVHQTGAPRTIAVEGADVRSVIEALEAAHPGMRFALCYETGELRPFVNIFLNGQHIRYLRDLDTPIPSGATLHIFPSVAGG